MVQKCKEFSLSQIRYMVSKKLSRQICRVPYFWQTEFGRKLISS